MARPEESATLLALQDFAAAVKAKMTTLTAGEPEDQLRAPFESFMADVGRALARKIVCTGEAKLAGRLGKPDYAVHAGKLLAGFAELKAPGIGANPAHFKAHNKEQWERFAELPNLIYTDGNEWALFRSGEQKRPLLRLSGDIVADGKGAVTDKDAQALLALLADFLSWQPTIPTVRGKIDFRGFAGMLAPLCRMLRNDVTDALEDANSPLVQLAQDWRQVLFPDADNRQFADAYAQTVTFALLLARSDGAEPLAIETAEKALAIEHSLLSRALRVLTDPNAEAEISASLNLIVRVIGAVPTQSLKPSDQGDPWLYFYEDFLAAYDAKLRKDAGAYYTPAEVVHAQVRLVDEILTTRLGKDLGFADPGVITLDPAVGTGTYLLGVVDHALVKVGAEQGIGAVPGQASALANNVYGFENMVGPFAVTELRLSRALADRGATLPAGGSHIYLTDTLEGPNAQPPHLPFYLKPMAEQHAKALKVKSTVPVIVCIGNPPYDRHERVDESNKNRTGHWVRWGEDGSGASAILNDFIEPALASGHGIRIKNLYNLYVYFWRWALWKVFEAKTSSGPGVVSFISASSYLDGDAFSGMREHMRRLADEIWVLDLGGEGRGTRRSENVFVIQTPVAIAIVVRYAESAMGAPARVRYAAIIDGTREEKLEALEAVGGFPSLKWQDCPDDWQAPFRPAGAGAFSTWPSIVDLLPWQHSGAQFKRTWPISTSPDTLETRWTALLAARDRKTAFKESRDRKIGESYPPLRGSDRQKPIAALPRNSPAPQIERYGYRAFDRQWVFADNRLGDFLRPHLWASHSERQIYMTTLLNHPLGGGPALVATCDVPDLHHFRGSFGAKEVLPLFRDAGCREPNILPGLLEQLAQTYHFPVSPEDFLAYIYGLLAHPDYTGRFARELGERSVRIPLTRDGGLFARGRDVGAKLLWLHTYGQRLVPRGKHKGKIPRGNARCLKPVPNDQAHYPETYHYNEASQTLYVGTGEFAPVPPYIYAFEVSGLIVLQSWLGYRKKKPKGKKSSPLNAVTPDRWPSEFTTELLELLWLLEATVDEYALQAKLLSTVINGPCFLADELPPVPKAARKPPGEHGQTLFADEHADDE